MDAYALCTDCDRHIRRSEPRCPFCRAIREPEPRAARQQTLPRISRAQWLALGSTIALGCSGPEAAQPPPVADATVLDTGSPEPLDATGSKEATASDVAPGRDEAGEDSSRPELDSAPGDAKPEGDTGREGDAALDAGEDAPAHTGSDADADTGVEADTGTDADTGTGADPCVSRDGTFACVPGYGYPTLCCDRQTEYCNTVRSFGAECVAVEGGSRGFPSQCVASRTCACLDGSALLWGSCKCERDDDAGAITIACGACYGSPPARLERLVRAA